MFFIKKSLKIIKNQKSVFAKSFRLPKVDFWRKQNFDFFHRRRFFPEKPSFFAVLSLLNTLSTSKSGLQSGLTPDHMHPHAPNFHGSPQPPFPGSRAIFGAIAALAREKSTKNTFSVVHPPPLAKSLFFMPKTTKIAISRKSLDRIILKFQGALVMI